MLKKIITNKIFLIFVLALILRLGFLVFFSPLPLESSDAPYYNAIAFQILRGEGFVYDDELKHLAPPPLYPLFLAGIYKIFGQNYDVVRIIQAILSALTCVLIYLIAENLFNRKVGLIAALLVIIYPSFILQSTAILTETLFTFLLALAMLCLVLILQNSSINWSLAVGISIGLATLTRSVTLFFPILILPLMLLYKKKQSIMIAFRNFIFIVMAMFLIMSPWIFRDYLISRERGLGQEEASVAPEKMVASQEIKTSKMLIRNIKTTKNSALEMISNFYKLYRHPYALSDVTSYGYKEVFSKFIHGQIGFKGLLPVLKQGTFWIKIGILLFYYLILITALLGLIFSYKKWRKFLPLILVIVYVTIPHIIPGAVGNVNARYIFPIMPFIIILSAYGANLFINTFLLKESSRGEIKFC